MILVALVVNLMISGAEIGGFGCPMRKYVISVGLDADICGFGCSRCGDAWFWLDSML